MQSKRVQETLGSFSLRPFTIWIPVCILITCAITYYVAVSNGETKPFPYSTITNTATPYPQDILFRFVLAPSVAIFALLWLTIYYILTAQSNRLGGQVPVTTWIIYLGQIGCACFEMAIATIDSGKMADTLHSVSAVIFFVLWTINMVLITESLGQLRKIDPSVISYFSLLWKQIFTFLMVTLWIVEIISLAIPHVFLEILGEQGTDAQVCIVEWGSMLFLCLWVYTFSWDLKDYRYFLNNNENALEVLQEYYGAQAFQPAQQQGILQIPLNGFGQIIQIPQQNPQQFYYNQQQQNFMKVQKVYPQSEMMLMSQH